MNKPSVKNDTDASAPQPGVSRFRTWRNGSGFGSIAVLAVALSAIIAGVSSCRPAPRDQDPVSPSNALDGLHPGTSASTGANTDDQAGAWTFLDDPSADGWHTEVLSSRADKQLKKLGALLLANEPLVADKVRHLIAEESGFDPLLPPSLSTAFESDVIHVRRDAAATTPEEIGSGTTAPSLQGADGFAKALRTMQILFADNRGDLHFKFKVVGVTETDGGFVTRALFAFWGRTSSGMAEHHATWTIDWEDRGEKAPPLIQKIRISNRELTETHELDGPLFADCTEAALGSNDCYPQLLRGVNDWLERSQQRRYFFSLGTPGMAVGDVNGDGLEDIYLCQEEGTPNRLFLHQPDGTVVESAATWGVDWIHDSRSAMFFDWDNDGDQDLVVGVLGGVILAENDQGQRLTFRTMLRTSQDVMSMAAADYDVDGDVDLYVSAYYKDQAFQTGRAAMPAAGGGFVYHDANNGSRNTLFRNDGTGTFEDVTVETGMEENNHRFSFAASWEDYDNDGDPDLYVANDYGRDCLYRNDAGHFSDVADAANIENSAGGMGVTWADFDRNGYMDVYISNMWSSAGKRIAFQPQFKADAPPEVKRRIQRSARGNTLLRGVGDRKFEHVSNLAGVELGRWAWSSKFVDLNNDGWDDIVVANGMVTATDTGDL